MAISVAILAYSFIQKFIILFFAFFDDRHFLIIKTKKHKKKHSCELQKKWRINIIKKKRKKARNLTADSSPYNTDTTRVIYFVAACLVAAIFIKQQTICHLVFRNLVGPLRTVQTETVNYSKKHLFNYKLFPPMSLLKSRSPSNSPTDPFANEISPTAEDVQLLTLSVSARCECHLVCWSFVG